MADMRASVSRTARFLASLVPALALFVGFFAVIGVVQSRFEGGIGLALGIAVGGSLAVGLLLSYWNLVDWLNIRIIRRTTKGGRSVLRDGEVVAFDGFVRTAGEPMTAPFSGTPCAAYAYVVAYSRHSSVRGRSVRVVLAQGFHMVRTRIEGSDRSLDLLSFPFVEDDLRETERGTKWGERARALVAAISSRASSAGEAERQSRLLEARHGSLEEVHQDYLMGEIGSNADALNIDEEVLPAGRAVTVVGTYDRERNGLTARRWRLGPNLFVYRGRTEEVLSRVGKETAGFAKAAAVLLGLGGLLLGAALSPPSIASRLPILGAAVVLPPEPAADNPPSADADAELRARIDGWVREEYAAGNRSRALELAIHENAHESLRWLIEQGISPEMPMRARGDWHQIPLVEATRLGYLESVRTLLEAGADPNAVEPPESPLAPGRTALGEALGSGYCAIAELLLRYGATAPEGLETNPCG
jgi:hypothetical protein